MVKEGRRDFDASALHWDEEPRRVKLAEEIAAAIREELPLSGEMVALDYGCGSGLVTLSLQPDVGRITGADSSRGMLDVLSGKLRQRGITNVDTMLIDLEERTRLESRYDLIVSAMTMHHVDDVAALIGCFAAALNPGGWLAVADLEAEDGSFHDDPAGVLHYGFDPEFFRSAFAMNGLTDIRVVTASTVEKPRAGGARRYPVILCMGRKQP